MVLLTLSLVVATAHADPRPRATVIVKAPRENQVLQRRGSGLAVPVVLERAFAGAETVTLTVRKQDQAWLRTVSLPAGAGELALNGPLVPAGAWYTLEVAQTDDASGTVAKARVEKFGVGDVFVIAGQSNAATWAEQLTKSSSGMAVMWDPVSDAWSELRDPMPFTNGFGGSYWPSFADLWSAHENVPVGLVNTAIGGTSVAWWQRGGKSDEGIPLYDRLLGVVKRLGAVGGFRMVLWHQGEADVNGYAGYRELFLRLVSSLDEDAGFASDWMVAKASFNPTDLKLADCGAGEQDSPEDAKRLREVQGALPDGKKIFAGPDGDDLRGRPWRYPGNFGMCVHFAAAAQPIMARRWFDAVCASQSSKK